MVTLISEKIDGMLVEIIEYKLPNCKILNSENIKFGDLVYLSEDGKNLNTVGSGNFVQIIGSYIKNNIVKLHYNGRLNVEKIFDTEVVKVTPV